MKGETMSFNEMYCTSCNNQTTEPKIRGLGWIEVILWLCYIIPGLIYSIWRRSGEPSVCPVCNKETLIPASPQTNIYQAAARDEVERPLCAERILAKAKLCKTKNILSACCLAGYLIILGVCLTIDKEKKYIPEAVYLIAFCLALAALILPHREHKVGLLGWIVCSFIALVMITPMDNNSSTGSTSSGKAKELPSISNLKEATPPTIDFSAPVPSESWEAMLARIHKEVLDEPHKEEVQAKRFQGPRKAYSSTSKNDTRQAEMLCSSIDRTGSMSNICRYSSSSRTITLNMATSRSDASNACRGISSISRGQGIRFSRSWGVNIYSPTGRSLLASCSL
jgi:hypothetical protein